MKASKKIFGIIVLMGFVFMAGSVICLASGQASVMSDCGNGMTTAAMCPFMSMSVPAVMNASSVARILGFVVALFLIAEFAFRSFSEDDYAKKFFATIHERKRDSTIGRRSDVVLNLISDGILHSRIFSF